MQFISAEERNVYCHFCMFNTFTEKSCRPIFMKMMTPSLPNRLHFGTDFEPGLYLDQDHGQFFHLTAF